MTNDANGDDSATAAAERDAALAATNWAEVDRALSGINASAEPGAADLLVTIRRDQVIRALHVLKADEELSFDYLRDLTAVDYEDDGIEVVYHLYSTAKKHNVTIKTVLPNDDLTLDTATTVWKAANWLERETAEMFGVRFAGHPDPRTLLMPEDMTDTFPLRKDHPLAEVEALQGEGMAYAVEDA
ncbi:MAG TPA: NADH-quinone oxidoreductase subunit C [Dehalococcoidia bacterium]|jgi:NADH-quinone oxidoreductase subunit C|nr:NADH-quinone oxidoreductase subunit C [Dehalococcoidia bacterium]